MDMMQGVERDMDLAQAILLKVPITRGYLPGKPEKLSLFTPSQKISTLLSDLSCCRSMDKCNVPAPFFICSRKEHSRYSEMNGLE